MPHSLLPSRVTRLLSHALVAVVLACLAASVLGVLAPGAAVAQDADDTPAETDGSSTVAILPVSGLLDPPVARTIIELLDEAAAAQRQLVILHVAGPGGVSVDPQQLVEAIETSPVPVAVMVAPRRETVAIAEGAWGLVWSAAHIRVVSERAIVGPLTPVDLANSDDDALAQAAVERLSAVGDPDVAAQMLNEGVTGLDLDSAGLVDLLADSYLELMDQLNGREVQLADRVVQLDVGEGTTSLLSELGLLDRMLHAAATPTFIYLLLVFGLSMLAFELFQPGFGVAGFAGLVMLPFAVFGLTILPVVWWALALLVIGLGLYVLDTSLASFGPLTAAATASFGVGSWWVFGAGALRNPPWVAVIMTVTAAVFWVVIMTTILRAQAGPEGIELDDLVGKLGIVRSVLNPEGHVYIDDALWRARLAGQQRLRVSAPIEVVGVDGAVLVVAPYVAHTEQAKALS